MMLNENECEMHHYMWNNGPSCSIATFWFYFTASVSPVYPVSTMFVFSLAHRKKIIWKNHSVSHMKLFLIKLQKKKKISLAPQGVKRRKIRGSDTWKKNIFRTLAAERKISLAPRGFCSFQQLTEMRLIYCKCFPLINKIVVRSSVVSPVVFRKA